MKSIKSILSAASLAVSMTATGVAAQEDTTMGKHTAVLQFGEDASSNISVEAEGIENCPGVAATNAAHFNQTVNVLCFDSKGTAVYSAVCKPDGSPCINTTSELKKEVSALNLQP